MAARQCNLIYDREFVARSFLHFTKVYFRELIILEIMAQHGLVISPYGSAVSNLDFAMHIKMTKLSRFMFHTR